MSFSSLDGRFFGAFLRRCAFLGIGLLIVLAFAACGSTATTTGNSGGSGSSSSGQNTPSTQTISCGKISSLGPQLRESTPGATQKAQDCFLQAFQNCQPATLQYTQAGVDAGMIHTFTITKKNGSCVVTDDAQHYVAPSPPRAATSYTCSAVKRSGGQFLVTGCGKEGDVSLPTPSYTSP